MATKTKGHPWLRTTAKTGCQGDKSCSLNTDYLNQGADSIEVDGHAVCLYGVSLGNENVDGHRIGGLAFVRSEGEVGCVHS